MIWWPFAFVLPALYLSVWIVSRARDSRIAKARIGESICDFARSFDCQIIDTWIIRGVYEEFSDSYPIHATDTFESDLGVTGEDLDDNITAIAKRIEVPLDLAETNPMYDKVRSVRDLVMFLHFQSKLLAQPKAAVE